MRRKDDNMQTTWRANGSKPTPSFSSRSLSKKYETRISLSRHTVKNITAMSNRLTKDITNIISSSLYEGRK